MADAQLLFAVNVCCMDGRVSVEVAEADCPRFSPAQKKVREGNGRTLSGREADAWLLAEQAGQLIGLRLQEVAVKVRASAAQPPPSGTKAKKKRTKKARKR